MDFISCFKVLTIFLLQYSFIVLLTVVAGFEEPKPMGKIATSLGGINREIHFMNVRFKKIQFNNIRFNVY